MTNLSNIRGIRLMKSKLLVAMVIACCFNVAQADILHLDDVIIDFSLCVGNDCVNGESFGFDTIRLKENNLRIDFLDTSTSASFPDNDWEITVNDSSNGGAEYFAITDASAGRQVFRAEAGAPANSLVIESDGDIGINTLNPVVELHVVDGDTPTLRLEQNGSSGFTPQTWDLAGNETNFFVRDATNGSTLPFKIRPSSPTDSIVINGSSGNVGLGESSPDEALHIKRNGTLKIAMEDSSTGDVWAFSNTVGEMRLSLQGSGAVEMAVASGGDVTIAGMLTELSDRNAKTNIRELDRSNILERVARLPISRWQYKKDDGVDHIGPMAQDFYAAFGLGENDTHIGTIDTSGVALAAIQALAQENKALKAGHKELLAAYHDQQQELERLDQLEQVVARMAEQQTANQAIFTSIK